MLRFVLVAALALALAGPASAGLFSNKQNKFIVTYSIVPDFFNLYAFYDMPRTTAEAEKDHFAQVSSSDVEHTTTWCRNNDYRVCVFFDEQGSVAGIRVAVRVNEIGKGVPIDVVNTPEWTRQTVLGQDVFSAITLFVSKELLASGGRIVTKDSLTAPEGLFILQTDGNGVETGRLHISNQEADAESAGFTEQACFMGMGKHYFQELRKDGTCEAHRPYFLLYSPDKNKNGQLNGLGFTMYGKPSKEGRGWFEAPPAMVATKIAPNSPDCMAKWINKYGLFTLHVFFVEKPYTTICPL